MVRHYFSKKYYTMRRCRMRFFFYYGFAIHGTSDINRLGGPASHGCVRLHPSNAARRCTAPGYERSGDPHAIRRIEISN